MTRSANALLHPLWWGALAVLLVNDHCLKGAGILAPFVTGKLSDFAGLLMAPMLLAALLRCRSVRGVALCHLAVGLGFALFELSPPAARALEEVAARVGLTLRLWPDTTDLAALLALPLSFWALGRPTTAPRQAWMRVVRLAGYGVGAFACVATSYVQPEAPPQFAEGTLYVRDGNTLIELDRRSGAVVHTHSVQLGAYKDFLVVADVLYFGVAGEVSAVDLRGRRGPWRAKVGPPPVLLAFGGELLYAQTNELLRAFDAASGRLVWSKPLNESGHLPPIGLDDSVIVVDDDQIVALDARDGRERWHYEPDASIGWTSAAGLRVVVGLKHGGFAVLDAGSGKVLVEHDTKAPALIWATSGPWTLAGHHLALGDGGELVVFDIDSGARLYERSIEALLTGSEDLIFALDDQGLVAFEAGTGAVRWRLASSALPRRVEYEPAAVDRGLLVVGARETMIGIDAATGKKLWDRGLSVATTPAP